MSSFDLAVIGAGPGGYVAAIRAAILGAKVVLIEKNHVGGVCLNRGCIPTKAMIASARALSNFNSAADYGVIVPQGVAAIDMAKVHARKEKVIAGLRTGIETLLRGRGIEVIRGNASFVSGGKIAVDGKTLDAKNILIATGSSWIELPNLKTDHNIIVTSDEALNWTEMPKRLLIVGGGVIGCEFACMMNTFGSKVTIIEATPSILPPVEKTISRLLARSMKSSGIEILVDTKVNSVHVESGSAKAMLSSGEELVADKLLVAVGRRPYTQDLNLAAANVQTDGRGFIVVDNHFKTSADHVFAIGDVIGGQMLAHAASAEGVAAVDGIFGRAHDFNLNVCPSPIFTSPEIGTVGLTSEELDKKEIKYKTGRFPYAANGKAMCDGTIDGQAIIHVDDAGKILGAHIIGPEATVLIAEAALAMKNELTVNKLAETIHAHPTLSEVVFEAVEDAMGVAIHKLAARIGNK